MAETDILNPVQGWWDVLGDNPNPNYGWTRRVATNKQAAKPRFGSWPTRETANAGHSYELLFTDRTWATVLRLRRFYEQFQYGYFTLIDYDANSRHHVGRFTSPPYSVETANGKYTIQGLVFEEIPRARMLVYPNDWDGSSHWIHTVDDSFNSLVSYSGGWSQQVDPRLVTYPAAGSASTLHVPLPQIQINDTTAYAAYNQSWGTAAFLFAAGGAGGTLTLSMPGEQTVSVAIAAGMAQASFLGTQGPGTYTLTASYSGDSSHPALTGTATITVLPASTNQVLIEPGVLITASSIKAVPHVNGLPIALDANGTPVLIDGNGSAAGTGVVASTDNTPANYELIDQMPAAGDWAQVEYVGWGFRIFFRLSPYLGLCDLYLDGVRIAQSLDLSTGAALATSADISLTEDSTATVVTMQAVPLDKHRVKVVALAQPGASTAAAMHGTAVIFPHIEVMH